METRSQQEGDDFYQVLGIPRQATNREIREAFQKLALLHHPDKSQTRGAGKSTLGTDQDSSRYLKIALAYETLADPQRRLAHDAQIRTQGHQRSDGALSSRGRAIHTDIDLGDFSIDPAAKKYSHPCLRCSGYFTVPEAHLEAEIELLKGSELTYEEVGDPVASNNSHSLESSVIAECESCSMQVRVPFALLE